MLEQMLEMFPHVLTFVAVWVIAFLFVMVANVADCIDAMITSRIAGRPIESAKLRHALWKLAKEWILLLVVFAIDALMAACWTKLPYITVVTAIAMIAVEVLSMVEHAQMRRDKLTKLPHHLKDIIEYFGEDDVREFFKEFAKKKLNLD